MAERATHVAGTGTFAAEIADIARAAGLEVVALLELTDEERVGSRVHGLPVVALEGPADERACALVGAGGDRGTIGRRLEELGWPLATAVHPGAHVAQSASLAAGVVVAPGAVIGACASIGRNALVSRG